MSTYIIRIAFPPGPRGGRSGNTLVVVAPDCDAAQAQAIAFALPTVATVSWVTPVQTVAVVSAV